MKTAEQQTTLDEWIDGLMDYWIGQGARAPFIHQSINPPIHSSLFS
jgi:hypothetical protein